MKQTTLSQRLLSFVLAFVMVFTMVPVQAFAAEFEGEITAPETAETVAATTENTAPSTENTVATEAILNEVALETTETTETAAAETTAPAQTESVPETTEALVETTEAAGEQTLPSEEETVPVETEEVVEEEMLFASAEAMGAATTGRYITSLSVSYAKSQSKAKELAQQSNHTLLDYDLNAGAGGDYIYMGYQRGDDLSKAITGVYIYSGKNPPDYLDYNGSRFYILGGSNEPNASGDGKVDLNKEAGGDYLYTYITRDKNFGDPLCDMEVTNASMWGGWETAEGTLNLNHNAGGQQVWLTYDRYSASVTVSAYYLDVYAGRQYATTTENVGNHEQAVKALMWLNQGTASDIFNSYSLRGYRLDNQAIAPNYSDATATELTSGRVYRAVYQAKSRVMYNASGSSGEPDDQIFYLYVNVGDSRMVWGSVTIPLSSAIPTHPDKCAFLGWSSNNQATTAEYLPGGNMTVNGPKILYAVWKEHTGIDDGLCDDCGISLKEPAQSGSVYQITNKAELIWFMQYVNKGNKGASAKVMNDIDMGGYNWTPIAQTGLYYKASTYNNPDKGYTGTFDGNGKVISNFRITASTTVEQTYGLFGTVSGTVKNLGITGVSYTFPSGTKDLRAGGIVGQMLPGSRVENSYVRNSTITPGQYIVGGIAACNYGGTIANCYTYKVSISGNERCGNLVSDTRGDINTSDRPGTVTNCYTDASRLAGTQTGNKVSGCETAVSAARFATGEVTWKLNGNSASGVWKQTIGTDDAPKFVGSTVYEVKQCDGKTDTYSNASTNPQAHTYVGGICSLCGVYVDGTAATLSKNGIVVFAGTLKAVIYEARACEESDEAVVTLLKDLDLAAADVPNIVKSTFTIDLNGKTLNADSGAGTLYFTDYRSYVTVVDSVGGGCVSNSQQNAVDNSTWGTVTLAGGSFQGAPASYALDLYGYSNNAFILTVGANGIGPSFPGGITANVDLSAILDEGCAYWAVIDGKDTMLTVAEGTYAITDKGDITVKKICTHTNGNRSYVNNGEDHTYTWSCCNIVVTEDHSYDSTKHICACGAVSPDAVAKVSFIGNNGTYYTTLQDAIQAVADCDESSEATVTLLKDIDLGDVGQVIDGGVFAIDLHDCEIRSENSSGGTLYITGGDVTIQDSGTTGAINGAWAGIETFGGTVTISGGTVSGRDAVYAVGDTVVAGGDTVNITGGIIIGNHYGVYGYDSTVNIQGGSVTGHVHGVYAGNRCIANISGGTVTGSTGGTVHGCGVYAYNSEVTISGGSVHDSGRGYGVYAVGSDITVAGGTISGEEEGIYAGSFTEVIIEGGEISGGHGMSNTSGSSYIITNGSISGEVYDFYVYNDAGPITLKLAEGKTEGASFPGGITVDGDTLDAMLDEGAAYWAGDTMLAAKGDAITDKGDITVKAACGHENGEKSYVNNGEDHTYTYDCCNLTITEDHSFTECFCACGAADHNYVDCVCDVCGDMKHEYVNGFCLNDDTHYEPATGNGTQADPYQIANGGQLYWFAAVVNNGYGDVKKNNNAHAVLTENIHVNEALMEKLTIGEDGTVTVADGVNLRSWTPIKSYYGTFNGNNKTISGLYANNDSVSNVALIGSLEANAVVKNVTVADTCFRGDDYVAGLVGHNDGMVEGCRNEGSVSGNNNVGGVVGSNSSGTVTECSNSGSVSGHDYVGGVSGDNTRGIVVNAYSCGMVSGTSYVGGVVGNNPFGTVANSYFDSTVYSGAAVGENAGILDALTGGKTTEQFRSGEVAYLLSQGCTVETTFSGDSWGQDLDNGKPVQTVPTFTGGKVYGGYTSCKEAMDYSNSELSTQKPDHSTGKAEDKAATCVEKAYCSVCGSYYGETDPDAHTQNPVYQNLEAAGHKVYYPCCQRPEDAETADHAYDADTLLCICGAVNPDAAAAVSDASGETRYYLTLQDALAAAGEATAEDQAVVKLLKDIQLDSTVNIVNGVFTLDLMGFDIISSRHAIYIDEVDEIVLRITDSMDSGSIQSGAGCYVLEVSNGTVTIEKGNFQGHTSTVCQYGGTLIIEGGTFTSVYNEILTNSGGKLELKGGTLIGGEYVGRLIYAQSDVTISGSPVFTELNTTDIEWYDGSLDLSGMTDPTGLELHSYIDGDVPASEIPLPEDYFFLLDGSVVDVLEWNNTYTVGKDDQAPSISEIRNSWVDEDTVQIYFLVDEDCRIYYAVVEAGAEWADVDTTGEGTACYADGENTIEISGLDSTTDKEVHFILKDAAGNTSGGYFGISSREISMQINLLLKAVDGTGAEIYGDLDAMLNGRDWVGTESCGYDQPYTVNPGENVLSGWAYCPEGYECPTEDITFTVDESGDLEITSGNAQAELQGDVWYIVVQLQYNGPGSDMPENALPVAVEGVWVTEENCADVLGDGTVSYDPEEKVLTLNNADIDAEEMGIFSLIPLTICLEGENHITAGAQGISCEGTDMEVEITGEGSLDIDSEEEAIFLSSDVGVLTLSGSVDITLDTNNYEGIDMDCDDGSLLIEDNAKLTIGTEGNPLAEEAIYLSVYDNGSVLIRDEAEVNIYTSDEEGIYVNPDYDALIEISGGTVNIHANEEAMQADTIMIYDGTVTAIGGAGYEGIFAHQLGIYGGSVLAGSMSGDPGEGIEADEITITGGTVKVISGGLMASSYDETGAYIPGTIELGEGMTIAEPTGGKLGEIDLSAYGEGQVLAVLNADGSFADALVITDGETDIPEVPKVADLYLGGVGMMSGDYLAVGEDEVSETKPEVGGYAYYEDGVLTLNNYTFEGAGYFHDGDSCATLYSKVSLDLVLNGQNSLVCVEDTDLDEKAVRVNGTLTISGEGSLNASGGHYGIYTAEDFVLNGGKVTVTADALYAIRTNYGMTITGGCLTAGSENDNGIQIRNGDLVMTGGTLKVTNGGMTLDKYDEELGEYILSDVVLENVQIVEPEGGQFVANEYNTSFLTDAVGEFAPAFVITDGKEDIPVYSGWTEIEGDWYYFDPETNEAVTGLNRVPYPTEAINGITYGPDQETLDYCADKGIAFIDAEEAWFDFDEDGKFLYEKTGVLFYEGSSRYVKNGMLPWHPGLAFYSPTYMYFIGDEEIGGNKAAVGDVYVQRNMTGRPITVSGVYTFDEKGWICEYDGITDMADGTKRYYEDAQLMLGNGLTQVEDDYIYVRSNGELVVGKDYYVPVNDLGVVPGTYGFDGHGHLINPERTDKNGIYEEGGKLYYYRDGVIAYNAGLIYGNFTWHLDEVDGVEHEGYIYVRSNGQLATGKYWITAVNDIQIDQGFYTFSSIGLMADLKEGIVAENGSLYYYRKNKLQYNAGVIQLDGNYYYVRSNGEVVNSRSYWITNVGSSGVVAKLYTFDAKGVMQEPDFVSESGIIDGYYYINGSKAYGAGVVKLSDAKGEFYIYVRSNGQLATGEYWPTATNGYDLTGLLDWGTDGKLYI